jgi:predicted CXXCH cytochrome family protein
MKKIITLLAVAGLSLTAQSVVNTKHNLSATGTMALTTYTQVCKFCHSPHGANLGDKQLVPLWGHANTTQTFTMYGSNPNQTLKTTAIDSQPSGPSLACLSCHDGTVAVNARYTYGDATAPRWTYGNMNDASTSAADFDIQTDAKGNKMGFMKNSIAGASKNDLSTVHPIAIMYDTTANSQLVPVANLTGVKLFNGKVQCASCHDAHGTANSMFLRVTSTGSALCLACHVK